jgi:hypothetical protein
VDAMLDNISQTPVLNEEILENGGICCDNSELLKLKLQKVSSKLSSAFEIIKVLQEEDNPTQQVLDKPHVPQHNLEEKQQPTEDHYTNWMRYKPGRKTRVRNYEYTKQKVFSLNVNRHNALCTMTEPQADNLPISYKKSNTVKKNNEKNSEISSAKNS